MDNKEWDAFKENSRNHEENDLPLDESKSQESGFRENDEEIVDLTCNGEMDEEEDDAIDAELEEEEEYTTRYLPPWTLEPNQRITYKTITGAIVVLTLFVSILLWVDGPKAFERIRGNDLENDDLKGPVRSIEYNQASSNPQFSFLSPKPGHFTFCYDEKGNRIREEYRDESGTVTRKIEYTFDAPSEKWIAHISETTNEETEEPANKIYGLFDPIDTRNLKTNPNISQVYFDMKYDGYGNWTERLYRIRQHSRMYEPNSIGTERRNIDYYIPAPNPMKQNWNVTDIIPNSTTVEE